MALWDHGYVTDVAYVANTYVESTPTWLAAGSLLLHYLPQDMTAPFRYADLGCGNGLNAIAAAATNPNAEVWGFDFNPTHIEYARGLAAQAGLTNVRFEEMSFQALADAAAALPGKFDIMVTHGVLSWISLENRRHLVAAFDRWLRPGGLAYISYNLSTGWAGMEPVRLLMRQLAEQGVRRTDQEVPDIVGIVEQLKAGGARFFPAHPGLEEHLNQIKRMDPRYVAHEFLNRDWHPVMFADVAEMMTEARTRYIGSATFLENIDSLSVPAGIAPVLNATRDPGTRETMRDLAAAKAFRRDMWRRGGEPMPPIEQAIAADNLGMVWSGKPADNPIQFATPFGTVTGQGDFYSPMMDRLRQGPVTIGQLRAMPGLQNRPHGDFAQAALMLMGARYAYPVSPTADLAATRAATARLNAAILARFRRGIDMSCLVSPVAGCGLTISILDALAVGRVVDGTAAEQDVLAEAVLRDLYQSGRSLMHEGAVVRDPAVARSIMDQTIRDFLAIQLPVLRGLGIVPT